MATSIYYDGECPFCARYVTLLRLKETLGPVKLIDVRIDTNAQQELYDEGFNLDKGMVVEIDGRRKGGADAMNQLALLSTPSNFFNRFNKWVMSFSILATCLYPILRMGRWCALFFMGREQISSNDEGASARASIFGSLFALFSVFHFFNYLLEYQRFPPENDMLFIIFSAVLLFIKPESARLLWLLMVASTISAIVQAPIQSNHTIVRNFVVLGYWVSFFYAIFKNLKWTDIFTNFTTAGQGSLLVMYFFGVFHKINTDFLNPETSCAVTLWREMPKPLSLIDTPAMHYVAIYGTFIVEGILICLLFNRRTRHIAVVGGILFHLLLALSNYAMYISFTTLAISLHCLFLNEESALKVQNSNFMKAVRERVMHPAYFVLAIVLIMALAVVGLFRQYTLVTLLVLPILLPFCYVVIRYGSSDKPLLNSDSRLSSRLIGTVLTFIFFMNCWAPYMGLKSAQAVNMFANIRLEGGVSNHLIMREAPGPFKYLNDVVTIDNPHGNGKFKLLDSEQYGIVYYDVLAYLADNPDAMLSYTRKGIKHKEMTATKLKSEIDNSLHPPWFRKWFHFKNVELMQPEPCKD